MVTLWGCMKWKTNMSVRFAYQVTNQLCIKLPGHAKTIKNMYRVWFPESILGCVHFLQTQDGSSLRLSGSIMPISACSRTRGISLAMGIQKSGPEILGEFPKKLMVTPLTLPFLRVYGLHHVSTNRSCVDKLNDKRAGTWDLRSRVILPPPLNKSH